MMNVMCSDQETTSEELGKATQSPQADSGDTQELCRKLHDILNVITPETFSIGVEKILRLDINTEEKLGKFTTLIFEKALDKESDKILYANICKKLALEFQIKVPLNGMPGNKVNFRKFLLTLCQKVFEEKSYDILLKKNSKARKSADMIEWNELELKFAEDEARDREIENIKLIGELYKLNMLSEPIIQMCMEKLLTDGDEHSLHCLCELLKVTGKVLEERSNTRQCMEKYFGQIQNIIDTNSRVSCMLQNVVDLKKNNWDIKPKRFNDRNFSDKKSIFKKQRPHHVELSNLESYSTRISNTDTSRSSQDRLETVDTTVETSSDQALSKNFKELTIDKSEGEDKGHEMMKILIT